MGDHEEQDLIIESTPPAKTGMPGWTIALLAIFAVLICLMVAWTAELAHDRHRIGTSLEIEVVDNIIVIDAPGGNLTIDKETIELTKRDMDDDWCTFTIHAITGQIRNETDSVVYNLSLYFRLFDRDRMMIKEVEAFVGDIEPNQTWRFRGEAFDDFGNDVHRFELTEARTRRDYWWFH